MKVVDAIAEILKREGVKYLPCYPTTSTIEAAAAAGIRPIVCRQERVGMGIADGFSRVSNGRPVGVFTMQYGPGAENAYPGVARDVSGNYADMARAMGGYPERVENPAEIGPAIQRARRATEDGRAALLEFITCEETASSHTSAFR